MEAENQPAIYLKNPIKSVLPDEVTGIGHTNVSIGQLLDSVSHGGDRAKGGCSGKDGGSGRIGAISVMFG